MFLYRGTTEIEDTHLEASGSWLARGDISMIVHFKFRHHSDDSLDDERNDVRPHLLDVYAFSCQSVQHAGERALAACVLAVRVDEVAAVDVEGVVCQVHEDMAQILLAWFLQHKDVTVFSYLYIRV